MNGANMRGPRLVREAIASCLTARFPATLAECREAWDLSDQALPELASILPRPPQLNMLDRWPVAAVAVTNLAQLWTRGYEFEEPETEYQASYGVRVFLWVQTDGSDVPNTEGEDSPAWGRAFDLRDDLTTALRICVMDNPTMDRDDMTINPDTVVESYSDVTPGRGQRFLAGAYIGFTMRVDEGLTRPTLGRVEQVNIDAVHYPPNHPAL